MENWINKKNLFLLLVFMFGAYLYSRNSSTESAQDDDLIIDVSSNDVRMNEIVIEKQKIDMNAICGATYRSIIIKRRLKTH
jgi:hypothetical protein